jgi:MFS superfamily sulfate permease-like transporter
MTLMITVAVVLAIALYAARQARLHSVRLERDNQAMQLELEGHRHTAQSILRELDTP